MNALVNGPMAPFPDPRDYPLAAPVWPLPASRYGTVQLVPSGWFIAARLNGLGGARFSPAWVALPGGYASELEATLQASLAYKREERKA